MAETSRVHLAHDEVFEALANRRRRTVLRVLDPNSPVRTDELATHVVAEDTDEPLAAVTSEAASAVLASLHHVHLPRLLAASLVTQSDGRVTITNHPALAHPELGELIETEAPGGDAIFAALADKRRRVILSTLHGHDGPMNRTELVGPIARSERTDETTADRDSVGEVLQAIHHIHLPALDQAGLIEYDSDSGRVSYVCQGWSDNCLEHLPL